MERSKASSSAARAAHACLAQRLGSVLAGPLVVRVILTKFGCLFPRVAVVHRYRALDGILFAVPEQALRSFICWVIQVCALRREQLLVAFQVLDAADDAAPSGRQTATRRLTRVLYHAGARAVGQHDRVFAVRVLSGAARTARRAIYFGHLAHAR